MTLFNFYFSYDGLLSFLAYALFNSTNDLFTFYLVSNEVLPTTDKRFDIDLIGIIESLLLFYTPSSTSSLWQFSFYANFLLCIYFLICLLFLIRDSSWLSLPVVVFLTLPKLLELTTILILLLFVILLVDVDDIIEF